MYKGRVMSEDDILETGLTASGNVYRVTPLDRDAGGRGDHPFDSFCEPDNDEEEERKAKERENRRQHAARLARPFEDHLSLSVTALKAIGQTGHASGEKADAPQAPTEPKPLPEGNRPDPETKPDASPTPADQSGAETPPHVDFVA